MVVSSGIGQDEGASEDPGQSIGIMAHDRQAAASLRTVRSERAYNDVSPSLDCLFEPIGISGLIGFLGEEMERGPVVPQIVRLRRLPLCHVLRSPIGRRRRCSRDAP